MTTTDIYTKKEALGHLFRRAGFGATPSEIEQAMKLEYNQVVDHLLDFSNKDVMPYDFLNRFYKDQSDMRGAAGAGAQLIYRMVMTDTPLREKMCLFWHRIFATGSTKLIQNRVIMNQIDMFRTYGFGKFDDLLIQLSKDPAMIMWLDNQDNHKSNINENYGREILELFSMGVGNYTEEDIKETARAFTGWSVVNPDYMSIKMRNNTARPYGYISWQYEYDDSDHDKNEKTILGQTGPWNGEDAIRIICEQKATAEYIARHLYHYFVADELPVPQWPHEPPGNPKAIDLLVKTYFDSGHSIKAMLQCIFKASFFKAESTRYARIKSPAEMVVGTMRLAGPIELPSQDIYYGNEICANMGQGLLRPPSVEGWQGGMEWINTGAYMHRVNFAGKMLGDPSKVGLRDIIDRIKKTSSLESMAANELVTMCLEILGPIRVTPSTQEGITKYAGRYGSLKWATKSQSDHFDKAAIAVIQMIVSSQEYQTA